VSKLEKKSLNKTKKLSPAPWFEPLHQAFVRRGLIARLDSDDEEELCVFIGQLRIGTRHGRCLGQEGVRVGCSGARQIRRVVALGGGTLQELDAVLHSLIPDRVVPAARYGGHGRVGIPGTRRRGLRALRIT
jgi:hypothetical protein